MQGFVHPETRSRAAATASSKRSANELVVTRSHWMAGAGTAADVTTPRVCRIATLPTLTRDRLVGVHRQAVVTMLRDAVVRLPGGGVGVDVHGRIGEVLEPVEQLVAHLGADGP